jgi:septal ring factor EnvC (AmiA/AmiB activator)
MLVLAVAVGLGVWAFSLNAQLTQARADYRSLKSGNDKLTSSYNDLNTVSTKAQADLTAAQAQIKDLQSQLKKEQAANDLLKVKIAKIQEKVSILYAWEFGNETVFDRRVNSSGDPELILLWANLQKTKSKADSFKLADYIVQSIADASGLSLIPILVQNGALIGLFA